jgi:hypothetical protein
MNGNGILAVAAQHLGPIHAGTGGAGAGVGIIFVLLLVGVIMSNRG